VNEGLYDDAPDEPPTGGFPERRQDQRRTDDRLAHDMEGWVARLFIYRGRIIALVSSVTFLLTALGFRIIGPSQDIKALDQKFSAKDSIMSARVTRIEDSQGQIKASSSRWRSRCASSPTWPVRPRTAIVGPPPVTSSRRTSHERRHPTRH
jgi:hypothetical protein